MDNGTERVNSLAFLTSDLLNLFVTQRRDYIHVNTIYKVGLPMDRKVEMINIRAFRQG